MSRVDGYASIYFEMASWAYRRGHSAQGLGKRFFGVIITPRGVVFGPVKSNAGKKNVDEIEKAMHADRCGNQNLTTRANAFDYFGDGVD